MAGVSVDIPKETIDKLIAKYRTIAPEAIKKAIKEALKEEKIEEEIPEEKLIEAIDRHLLKFASTVREVIKETIGDSVKVNGQKSYLRELDKMKAQIYEVENTIKQVSSKVKTIEQKLSSIEEQIGKIIEKMEKSEKMVKMLDETLTQVVRDNQRLKQNIIMQRSDLDILKKEYTNLHRKIDGVKGHIAKNVMPVIFELKNKGVDEEKINKVEQGLKELHTIVVSNEVSTQQNLEEIKEKVENLEKRILSDKERELVKLALEIAKEKV